MLVWATCHTGSIREVGFPVDAGDSVESAAIPPHRAILTIGHAVDGGHGSYTVGGRVTTLGLDGHVVLRHVVVGSSVAVVAEVIRRVRSGRIVLLLVLLVLLVLVLLLLLLLVLLLVRRERVGVVRSVCHGVGAVVVEVQTGLSICVKRGQAPPVLLNTAARAVDQAIRARRPGRHRVLISNGGKITSVAIGSNSRHLRHTHGIASIRVRH